MKKMKLKVMIKVATGKPNKYKVVEHYMKVDTTPTEDRILMDFSAHYHKATGLSLPKDTEILEIKEV